MSLDCWSQHYCPHSYLFLVKKLCLLRKIFSPSTMRAAAIMSNKILLNILKIFKDNIKNIYPLQSKNCTLLYTGGPRYSRTFYLRIRSFTLTKIAKKDNFQVKNGLFICEFKIHGPKWRNVSTSNNEGNLYV